MEGNGPYMEMLNSLVGPSPRLGFNFVPPDHLITLYLTRKLIRATTRATKHLPKSISLCARLDMEIDIGIY